MFEETTNRQLFQRWERVWRDGEYGLVAAALKIDMSDLTRPATEW